MIRIGSGSGSIYWRVDIQLDDIYSSVGIQLNLLVGRLRAQALTCQRRLIAREGAYTVTVSGSAPVILGAPENAVCGNRTKYVRQCCPNVKKRTNERKSLIYLYRYGKLQTWSKPATQTNGAIMINHIAACAVFAAYLLIFSTLFVG